MKIREGGRDLKARFFVATGVNADGYREILGTQDLVNADTTSRPGAAPQEQTSERTTRRNGTSDLRDASTLRDNSTKHDGGIFWAWVGSDRPRGPCDV